MTHAIDIEIRRAAPAEAAAIADLTRRAFESQCALYEDPGLPPMSDTATTVLEAMSRGTVLVALQDDQLVGSVRGETRDGVCRVGRLVVEPSLQGRGIGRALTTAIESEYPDTERFEIFTGHASAEALHLYESAGYVRVREEPVHERLRLVFLAKRPG